MSILIPHAWIDDPGRHEKVKEIYERIQQNFEAIALNGTTQAYVDGEIADVVAGGINFGSPSATINAGDSAVEGVSTDATRADHQHAVSTGTAATLSGSNAEGTATSLARSDHNHALGGSVGGVLSGTLPNPSFAADMATQAELDAHTGDTSDAHDASAISFSPAGTLAATDAQAAIEEAASEAATALSTHEADTTSIHGIADTSVLATATDVATAVSNHDADTTVHGVDTANVPTSDEKDALQGTSGDPSDTNRYVTDEDGRLASLIGVPWSDAVLNLNPLLFWRYSETSGTAVDDSTANNRDGTTTGTVTRNAAGAIASDADPGIDLGGGHITSSYDPFTVGAARTYVGWANPDALGSGGPHSLLGGVADSVLGFSLALDDADIFANDSVTSSQFAYSAPSDGSYFFWALSCADDGESSLYINGSLVGSLTFDFTDATTLMVGDSPQFAAFAGLKDEFAIFETAFTAGQVEYLYLVGLGEGGFIPKSTADAKGDLIVASANNEVDNLTVGANDTILMADSGQTLGVKWAAPASPSAQVDPGDAASEGTADTWARSDHQHAVSGNLVRTSGTGAESGLRILRGIITTTTPTINEGTGFSVAKNATGDVTITFTTAFSDVPAIALGMGETSGIIVVKLHAGTAPTASTARVDVVNVPGAALIDGTFHFIAIGPA